MANLLNERLNDETVESKKAKKKAKKSKANTVSPSENSNELTTVEKKSKKKNVQEEKIKPKTNEEIKAESDNENFDEKLEALTGEEYVLEQKKLKRSKRKFYLFKISICFLCGYLLFLIYGVMVTNYDYNKDGEVEAQIMTREDIKNQKEYSTLLGYYIDARSLYEQILLIDYRLEKNPDDAIDLVPEYESWLDTSNKILVQLKAFSPSKAYTPAYNLLINWVNADLSSYLQEISAALSQSSAEHMQNAINDKERIYNDCYQLTANMISLGEKVKGVDISTLKEWSPEEFIKEEMGDV